MALQKVAKVGVASLALLYVYTMLMPMVAMKGRRASQQQRRGLEDDLNKISRIQHEQQKLLDELARSSKGGSSSNPSGGRCKDKHDSCPDWVSCCPNGAGDGTTCGQKDCSAAGDKPCEGLWMSEECPKTCGVCPGMKPRYPEPQLVVQKDILTIWEKEGKDEGMVEGYDDVKWMKFHEKNPRVTMVKNVLTKQMAADMIELARPRMERSQVVHPTNSSEGVADVRTSEGMWMSGDEFDTPMRRRLTDIVSKVVDLPESHFEALQILHYREGEYYIHHSDFFESHMVKFLGTSGNRVATSVVFLNTIPEGEGGDTKFVYAEPEPVSVTPETGTGVIFYNVKRNHAVDRSSEHEAVPPKNGREKWVAIFWVREKPF